MIFCSYSVQVIVHHNLRKHITHNEAYQNSPADCRCPGGGIVCALRARRCHSHNPGLLRWYQRRQPLCRHAAGRGWQLLWHDSRGRHQRLWDDIPNDSSGRAHRDGVIQPDQWRQSDCRAGAGRGWQVLWHDLLRRHDGLWHSIQHDDQWHAHLAGFFRRHQRRLSQSRAGGGQRWQLLWHDSIRRNELCRHNIQNDH